MPICALVSHAVNELRHTSSSSASATPPPVQHTSFDFVMEYATTGQETINATPDVGTSAQSTLPSSGTMNGTRSDLPSISPPSFSTSSAPTPNTTHLLGAPSDSKYISSTYESSGQNDRQTKSERVKDPNLFRTIIIPSNSCIPPKHPEDIRSLSLTLGVVRKSDGEIEFVPDQSAPSIPGPQDRTWVEGGQLIPKVSNVDAPPAQGGAALSVEHQAAPLASTPVRSERDESVFDASNMHGWSFDQGTQGPDDMALDAETAAQFNAVFGSFNDSSLDPTVPVVSGLQREMAGITATDDASQQSTRQSGKH